MAAAGGSSYLSGGAGGTGGSVPGLLGGQPCNDGGFGGGGQGNGGGGGGGGYSGGGGGYAWSSGGGYSGGGGGSYLAASATNAVLIIGNSGNGLVTIAQELASLTVGSGSSYQSVSVNSGSGSFFNISIGSSQGTSDNSLSVAGPGTEVDVANNVLVGRSGTGNTLTISAGGSLVGDAAGVIGLAATASANRVLVTGSDSFWSTGSTFSSAGAGRATR